MEFVEYKKRKKQKIDSPLANQNKQVRTPREMIQPSNLDGGYFILFFCLSKKKRPNFSCCVGTEIYYAEALFFISLHGIFISPHPCHPIFNSRPSKNVDRGRKTQRLIMSSPKPTTKGKIYTSKVFKCLCSGKIWKMEIIKKIVRFFL
jgi:hypothetical protein